MIYDIITKGALAYARATAPFARARLDRQIDNLVYELYDLTPEEIAIVEGSGQ